MKGGNNKKMPFGDQTGPRGRGPRTGRGKGYCEGFDLPNFTNVGFGRGIGRGIRRGTGYGRNTPFVDSDEKEFLKVNLRQIEKRIKELESK